MAIDLDLELGLNYVTVIVQICKICCWFAYEDLNKWSALLPHSNKVLGSNLAVWPGPCSVSLTGNSILPKMFVRFFT